MQDLGQKEMEQNAVRNEKHVGVKAPTGVATFIKNAVWSITAAQHGSGSGSCVLLQHRTEATCRVALANTHLKAFAPGQDDKMNAVRFTTDRKYFMPLS